MIEVHGGRTRLNERFVVALEMIQRSDPAHAEEEDAPLQFQVRALTQLPDTGAVLSYRAWNLTGWLDSKEDALARMNNTQDAIDTVNMGESSSSSFSFFGSAGRTPRTGLNNAQDAIDTVNMGE